MKISVIIPCYNNEESIEPLINRVKLLEREDVFSDVTFEYVFVDDGSVDNTYKKQMEIKARYDEKGTVKLIKLTRNFGSYNSFLAGMQFATGDCNVYLHADLQDPPELIPEMFRHFRSGYHLVIANRTEREDKNLFSGIYHFMVKKFAISNIPKGGYDLIMFSRDIRNHIVEIAEKNTNNVYLISWLGFPYVSIPYTREKRRHGKSQWTFRKKIKLFVDTFYSFTNLPLWLMRSIFVLSGLVFFFLLIREFQNLGSQHFQLAISFFSFLVLTALLIAVEYLDRIHETVRKRPNFIVEKVVE